MTADSRISGVPRSHLPNLDDFSMVGAGSLSRVLCRSLVQIGMRLDHVVARTKASAQRIIQENETGGAVEFSDFKKPASSLLLLCVPDDALASVSERLARLGSWKGITVLHTSGVHNKNVLGSLAERGAATGSFHPLQTFLGDEDRSAFKGITVGIEGDEAAVACGKSLANSLMAEPLEVPSEGKALYHAAAALASNAAVTLMAVSEEMWAASLGHSSNFLDGLGPVVEQSVKKTLSKGPSAALTGPISRGDIGTVTAHLQAISKSLPHMKALYGSIATETVHLAMRSGRISAEVAVALLDVISDHLSGNDSIEHHP